MLSNGITHDLHCPIISACIVFLAVFNLSAFSGQNSSAPRTSSMIERRIRRIQEGLLPPVVIQGESGQTKKLADRMSDLRVPGVSIAVIHNGRIDWARGIGVARAGGTAVTPGTLFQAASISKSVTGMAVMRLVQEKKLDLDSDVSQYLRAWTIPPNDFTGQSKVTLRRLLSHTAGITGGFFMGYAFGSRIPSLLQILDGKEPANNPPVRVDTEPGKIWKYSAGGYAVVQQILDDATGKPFPELMRNTIFRPIGMHHSTFEQPLAQPRLTNAAMPYGEDGQPIREGPHVYPEMAAAGLWTTPSDLARWAIDIQESLSGQSKRVLTREIAREMITPVLESYALGLGIRGSAQRPCFYHSGRNAGYCCFLAAYPDGEGAVIMTNSDNGAALYGEILRAIAREYNWPDFRAAERKEIKVALDIMKQYPGTYKLDELEPGLDLVITLEGNQLISQATGQSKYPLFAESETKFFWKASDAEIEFFKNDKGLVTHLILHQGAKDIKAPRK